MKKTISGIALVMLMILVTGCNSAKTIVGKWRAEGYSVDYYYIFNEDKTCAYEMSGAKMECTYEDAGTKVTVLYKGNTVSNTYEYKIEDNKLIIKDNLGNDVTYVRK